MTSRCAPTPPPTTLRLSATPTQGLATVGLRDVLRLCAGEMPGWPEVPATQRGASCNALFDRWRERFLADTAPMALRTPGRGCPLT